MAGWESTKRDLCKISNTLRKVSVTAIDQKIYSDAEHYNFKLVIEHSMICVNGRKSEDDSCEVSKLQI